jgi:DNA-binding SARP family transcriptional activator
VAATNNVQIRLLGELEVQLVSGARAALPASRRTRALLAFLAGSAHAQTRTRLCELFWSGPSDPRGALRWSLTKLRPLVPLATEGERVALAPGTTTDIALVRGALMQAASTDTESLESALAQFRGEPFEGLDLHDCFGYQEWLSAEREGLRRLELSALSSLSERLSASAPERALAHARRRVSIDPLTEQAHVEVMELLARLGRVREALAHYERCRRMLDGELGKRTWPLLEQARVALSTHAGQTSSSAPRAVSEPPRAEVAHDASASFVGRARERESLKEALQNQHTIVLILGDPGIGKSRLLEVAAQDARARGSLTLYGRAFEAEMVRPYGPWIDALRALPLSTLSPELRGQLAPLLPELSQGIVAHTDRALMFDAILAFLTELSGMRSLSIALDDVQWLDDASASLVHYLARRGTCPLLLAARPGELEDNAPVRSVLRTLRREANLTEIALAPLSRAETATLLARTRDEDALHIYERSAGNPLFALELAKALAQGMALDALPDTLQGLLQERFGALSESAKALVPWAATLGHSFALDWLGELAQSPPNDLLRGVEELERRGIFRIATAGQSQFGYDFAHDLLRRAAYLGMSAPRRALCHARAAALLAKLPDADGALAGDLVHHAALAGQDELAASAAVSAGQRCLRLFAHTEAVEIAERGLHHVARLAGKARLGLLVDLWGVLVLAAPSSRHAEIEDALSAAVALAAGLGEVSAVATGSRALSVLRYMRGDFSGAGDSSDVAAKAFRGGEESREVAGEIAHSARCLLYVGRVQEARGLFAEARALATRRQVGHIELPFAEACLRAFDGEHALARALFHETLQLARESRDHWRECECLIRLSMLELESDQDERAATLALELKDLAGRMEADGADLRAAEALVLLATLRRADETQRGPLYIALARLVGVDNKSLLAYAYALLADADLAAQRYPSALAHAQKSLEMAEAVRSKPDIAIALALCLRARHRPGQAEDDELVRLRSELARCAADASVLSLRARSALSLACQELPWAR